MILYTEELLKKLYDIYRFHQSIHDVPFLLFEDFRAMYEEQEEEKNSFYEGPSAA